MDPQCHRRLANTLLKEWDQIRAAADARKAEAFRLEARRLEYEAQQQVPHPLDEVFWDRRVIAIREDGEVHATLFAVKKALVEDRLRKLAKARFPVDGIQLRPIALHNFCAYERLLEPGTIVIDVDYAGLQVLIHHDDQTWFRVLPVGGVDLVQRLRETFDCDHRTAVRMATGQAPPPDQDLFEACRREVAQDIVDEATKTVRYYLAAKPHVRPTGVVLFESHGCVPPLNRALKRTMDMPVFRPKGFRHLEVDPEVVTAGVQEHFPALAKAAGLALQGVAKAEIEVRLFPDSVGRNLDSRKRGYVFAAVCLLFTILIAGWNRGSAAEEIADKRKELETAISQGLNRAAVEKRLDVDAPLEDLRALKEPARGRTGPIPLVTHLYALHAAWDKGPAPQIVAIDYSAADARKARVILAFQVGLKDGATDIVPSAAMEAFAQSLADGKVVRKATAVGDPWRAGTMTYEKPIKTAPTMLRFLFAHRAYELELGGES